MKSRMGKSRSLALDFIRIIADLAVVMIHTSMEFVKFDIDTSSYMWGNIFDALSRLGVPLFVMVSGALMLDEEKEVPVKKVFSKYILNIALLYISWSAIYALPRIAKAIMENQTITFDYIIKQLVSGSFHMWYLVMIIGLYLAIPALKLFVKKENSDKILYIILLSLLFMFVPTLLTCLAEFNGIFVYLREQLSRFCYGFAGPFLTYFITGWYVTNIGVKYKKTIYLLAAVSAVGVIALVQATGNYSTAYANVNILVYLYSLGVFTFVNDVCKNKVSSGIIEKLSNMTFGVYIIHVIVLEVVNMFLKSTYITPLSLLIKFSIVTIVSFAGSFIMSKIPLIKKLVRF